MENTYTIKKKDRIQKIMLKNKYWIINKSSVYQALLVSFIQCVSLEYFCDDMNKFFSCLLIIISFVFNCYLINKNRNK